MTNNERDEAYWMRHIEGRGVYQAKDDFLHLEARQTEPDETLTESQYFGLCMPEEAIHGSMNLYHHANIGNLTGGVWIFQGRKAHHLASEIFDWRARMSDKVLAGDLHDYTMTSGYRVRVIEPAKRFHLTYDDKERDSRFDLEYTALMEPYMLASGDHFLQHMRAEGELVLRGRKYKVDSLTVRNRSWGQARSEANQRLAPLTWMSGVFDADNSFYCSAFDDPADHPEWGGEFPLPAPDRAFSNGFIRLNGEVKDLVAARKRIVRNQFTFFPETIELELVDQAGHVHQLTGSLTAGASFSQWYNINVALCQARWSYAGRTGYGDAQDLKWGDFLYRALNGRDA